MSDQFTVALDTVDAVRSLLSLDALQAATARYPYYNNYKRGATPLLPPGLRYLGELEDVAVLEVPPRTVTVRVNGTDYTRDDDDGYYNEDGEWIDKDDDDYDAPDHTPTSYTIHLPWQVYLSRADSMNWVFFRNEMLTSLDDELFVAPLPNQYSDGHFCLNHAPKGITVVEQVLDFSATMWSGMFNNELTDMFSAFIENSPKDHLLREGLDYADLDTLHDMFALWSRLSQAEVLDVPWPRYTELHPSDTYNDWSWPLTQLGYSAPVRSLRDWIAVLQAGTYRYLSENLQIGWDTAKQRRAVEEMRRSLLESVDTEE